MSKHIVARVLQVCGPCRILHAGAKGIDLLQDLLLAGCDAYAAGSLEVHHPRQIETSSKPFDAVLVEISSPEEASGQLESLFKFFQVPKILILRALGLSRVAMECHLLEELWRRHPGGMVVHEYESLSDDLLSELSFYERVPDGAPAPKQDALRQTGARADSEIVRYALAAQFVRPGDTVLDCASGLGSGTAILASLSMGATLIGVDADSASVEYARMHYSREGVSYRTGDASRLQDIPDSSIDIVVSFETLPHVRDWESAVKEFHRVLKPDGRLIVSVPDRWVDRTNMHMFDWATLETSLNRHFFLEMRYAQTAPGGLLFTDAPRSLRAVQLDAVTDTEWLIAVACKSPLEGAGYDFKHPEFQASFEKSGAAIVDFARTYDNPYLYRAMVQMGERVRHDLKLATLAYWVITNARADSADRGAAICVFGYQVLEKRETGMAPRVLEFVEDYLRVTAGEQKNAHVLRWRLSLSFLAGRLCELLGDRERAARWYHSVPECGWRSFSPVLATKTIAACFFEGRIHLAEGDIDQAKSCFARGLEEALAALRGDVNDIVGNPEQPIPFGLTELAEVIDMGSQCANAIARLPLWKRDPGLFWKHVDVKRFGLASWAKELERENQELRSRLAP
jgi:2-polyprenyl-3-methyl-5-hydroxy-6-metoxy-1,4-benzoquinol methylase